MLLLIINAFFFYMGFHEKYQKCEEKNNSLLCIGLDIDSKKIPKHVFKKSSSPLVDFNEAIIDATHDLVCSYKLNLAFYEQYGIKGIELLEHTIKQIPHEIPIILDGKRNDIGITAAKYATFLFDILKADAITVNPYLGFDGIAPFLKYRDQVSFVLCKTSNPSAGEFQDLMINDKRFYEHVAQRIVQWNIHENIGAVVGATYPEELQKIRTILSDDIPILIPGIGKQGGDIKKTVDKGTNSRGSMAIINSSRSIIYADNTNNFAKSARNAAQQLRDAINRYRKK